MTARCRPGDLAIVVKAHNEVNLGRVVRVLRVHVPEGELAMRKAEPVWDVEADRELVWTVGERAIWLKVGPAADSQLRPLRSDMPTDSDDEKADTELADALSVKADCPAP